MQHIQQMFPKTFQGHDVNFGVDYFRDRIPQLDSPTITDEFVMRHRALLLEYLRQDSICHRCDGFAKCGKDGDMKGFTQVLETPITGQFSVGVQRCQPFHEFMARHRVNRFAQTAGMMEFDSAFQFDNYPREQSRKYPNVLKYAKEFAHHFDSTSLPAKAGLYLFGPPGVGKTHLMFAVFNALRASSVPCLVVRSDSLFDRMRHMIADGQDLEPLLETLATVPVLGIDEFAQERANDFTMEKLFRIINHRFHAKLSTWFTSNYAPPKAYRRGAEDVNDAVSPLRSRVMNMCILVQMDGPDARQQNLQSLT